MVFVHARNETVRTATVLAEMARNNGDSALFLPPQGPQLGDAQRQFAKSRNKPLKELFPDGFGMYKRMTGYFAVFIFWYFFKITNVKMYCDMVFESVA